jgi:hypothetical protein
MQETMFLELFISLLFNCIAKSEKYPTWQLIKYYGNYPSHSIGTALRMAVEIQQWAAAKMQVIYILGH